MGDIVEQPRDEDLIARARSGETLAYAELVKRYQVAAFRTAYLITRSSHDAEEATQEAFVKAWKALSRFRTGAGFRPWILRIAKNEALNRIRSRSRRGAMELRVAAQPARTSPSTEAEVMRNAEREAVGEAVDRLPERLRLVVSCLYFLGLNEKETAQMLRIPQGTVKSRAARARAVLATQVADESASSQ